ncbi:MliC family protein [Pseudomonas sp. 5P_3.1_Bac2]|uniref:MliC family protein n=1 Tax=Pseudomonas sp. 5P_3.1_Bac2 TaxID=2971617 RepID=UPI0021C9CC42|nr:MliC family protein [Pseudomonas sp. 5P_3.1_Bac2]MCU1718420.1 MliC family protein [Pseudomonas sp. 5P_3.1_Bac2]
MHHRLTPVLLLTALGLLSACSSQPQSAGDTWNHWECDSQAQVQWRYADSKQQSVDVRVGGDDIVHRLRREVSGTGELYSDPLLSFQLIDQQGVLYRTQTDDLIGRGCKAK